MNVFDSNDCLSAFQHLHTGGILAYPTESVWGLGCDPFNQQAVNQLLMIKQRPMTKGLIVITADQAYIQDFLKPLSQKQQQFITQSWYQAKQQATTWLLPIPAHLQPHIPIWITGGRNTLAIRVIHHTAIRQLCETIVAHDGKNRFGFLISTSCNPSQKPPAINLIQAQNYFGQQVAYLSGETLGFDQPSQIKDVISQQTIRW